MTTFAPTFRNNSTTRGRHNHRHEQGFCATCGSTWPCWGAGLEAAKTSALRATSALGLPRC